jgi:16S rRNA (cytosine1402-N4)-methyltransferase
MLLPVVELLAPRPGGLLVDGTVGLGGHAEALLRRIGPEGRLVGLDRDPEMLARAETRLAPFGAAARLVHARLSRLGEVLDRLGIREVDGILLDLGLCSAQIDDTQRGFSFRPEARAAALDMRFDRQAGRTAAELIAQLSPDELAALLRSGGVPAPRRVAEALLEHSPIRTAGDLLDALRDVRLPPRRHHPATLVFQALRMAVNDESAELDAALEACTTRLRPGGRLAVLSYHSGEDRCVKRFLRQEVRGCTCPPRLPGCVCGRVARLKLRGSGQGPAPEERLRNPRARSARLRGAERC